MNKSHAYYPVVTETDSGGLKVQKKGSYCNWESALAHVRYDELVAHARDPEKEWYAELDFTPSDGYTRAVEHIHSLVGPGIRAAPFYTALEHFGGGMSVSQYADWCDEQTELVTAVKICGVTGDVTEVVFKASEGVSQHLQVDPMSRNSGREPSEYKPLRKTTKETKDRELLVYFWPTHNDSTHPSALPYNTAASQAFKVQIYGDVLVTQVTKEACAFRRKRYVNYTKAAFEDAYMRKRKRMDSTVAMDVGVYTKAKADMQESLDCVEEKATQHLQMPQDISRAKKLKTPQGDAVAASRLLPRKPTKRSKGRESSADAPLTQPCEEPSPSPCESAGQAAGPPPPSASLLKPRPLQSPGSQVPPGPLAPPKSRTPPLVIRQMAFSDSPLPVA